MTKLKQIAIVMGEGEDWLHFLFSSTGTMIKKDLPCLVLGLGKVSITAMVKVEVISNIAFITRGDIKSATTVMANIKGAATSRVNIVARSLIPDWCDWNIHVTGSLPRIARINCKLPRFTPVAGMRPRISHVTGTQPRNTLAF